MRLPACIISAAIATVIAALAPAAGAASFAPPSHEFLFSVSGEIKQPGNIPIPAPEGELEDACGVATDSHGDLYVSDYYHGLIYVYGPDRKYLTEISDPDVNGPCDLAVSASGEVFANDWRRDVVGFTPSSYPPNTGTHWTAGVPLDSARSTGVAIDPSSGDIYVDDRTYVAVYAPDGDPVLGEGGPLRIGQGTLGSGYGVAVSNYPATEGWVYVADASDRTVKAFDSAGNLARVIDGAGTPQEAFNSLEDAELVIDSADGHLLVLDNLEPGEEHPLAAVDEFNAAGEYRGQLPHTITDAEPSGLALDASRNVLVTSGNDEGAQLLGFGPTLAAHRVSVELTGAGSGRVVSNPAGINCPTACAAEFGLGAEILLHPLPAPGSEFAGWSGACHGFEACRPQGTANLVAEFVPAPPVAQQNLAAQLAIASAATTLDAASSPPPPGAAPQPRAHRHHRCHRRHCRQHLGRGH